MWPFLQNLLYSVITSIVVCFILMVIASALFYNAHALGHLLVYALISIK